MEGNELDFDSLMKKLDEATAVNATLTAQITELTKANSELVAKLTKPTDEIPDVEKDAMALLNEALTGLIDKEVSNGDSK